MKNAVAIICTNDAHCALEPTATSMGYAGVASIAGKYRERYGDESVFLVDAGDCFGGGVAGLLSDGLDPLKIMNACGYDAMALGNADFTFGAHKLKRLEAQAEFPFLCCNFLDTEGKTPFSKYCIKAVGSSRVGFVGVITPRAVNIPSTISDDGPLSSNNFCADASGQALCSAVQSAVDEVRAKGVDYVVLLSHLGQGGQKYEWSSKYIVHNTIGINIVVDGHSHECLEQVLCNKEGELVTLIQAGTTLSNVGAVLLDLDTGAVQTELLGLADAACDGEIFEIVSGVTGAIGARMAQPVGVATEPLIAKDAVGVGWIVRSQETNLGDLVADAYRAAIDADAAYIPAWTIRSSIQSGAITRGDIFRALPLGMDVSSLEVTGRAIADLLEFTTRFVPESNGSFPQVSGISFTLDTSIHSAVVVDESGNFDGLNGPRRVRDIRVGGVPIDFDATYALAGVGLLMENAGEGLSMLAGASVLRSKVTCDVDAVIAYVEVALGGTVSYGYENSDGSGRIRII